MALPFVAADDGAAAGEAVECFNPSAAVMKAEALSHKSGHVGAVAFNGSGNNTLSISGNATLTVNAVLPLAPGTYLVTVEINGHSRTQRVEMQQNVMYLRLPLDE